MEKVMTKSREHEVRSRKSGAGSRTLCKTLCLLASCFLLPASVAHADWLQGRGNVRRTGTQELKAPMIKAPKVRWAFKSQEHFVAAPVAAGDLLNVSGLGAFNSAAIHAVSMEDVKAAA